MFDSIWKIIEKDYAYYKDEANRRIILIKSTSNQKRREKEEIELLKSVSDVVRKNINNFKKLCINTNLPFDRDDTEVEAYIIFKKCINNYKLTKESNFYFFVNKAMNQNFYMLYKKRLEERNFDNIFVSEQKHINPARNHSFHEFHDFVEFDLVCLGFDDLERKIIASKVQGQTKEDFLDLNPKITGVAYNDYLKSAKKKLQDIKKDLI